MKLENINSKGNKIRVLLAPLDWGLGHAARCIPIIYELLAMETEVIIAADGLIKNLLKKEFPDVVFTHLKGYNIRYGTTRSGFALKILLQFPRLLWRVYTEQRQIKKIVKDHQVDVIISDNRVGLFHAGIPCVYITHQLQIKTNYKISNWLAQNMHYFFINKFSVCWVPDDASANNLAGELSHPKQLPKIPVHYLGPLSRFQKIAVEKKYDLLCLLSGPEPQRSLFEKILLQQLKQYPGKVLVVQGLPGTTQDEAIPEVMENNINMVTHLPGAALNKVIQQSEMLISRSGYTTIMDLAKLQQKAILVPTPGQAEQEYLACFLKKQQLFFSMDQNHFSLEKALETSRKFSYRPVSLFTEKY
jgi:uncharacterized protein (TIGR00661 family)